ncbi:MAG: hypothetical protein KAX31_05500, partial [Thermoplasmata archaeon]|nr:hypothetical protein [Thermoplasmata archaeon]
GGTPLGSDFSVPIPANNIYTFDARMVVPDGTRPGTYECAIYVDKIRTVTDEVAIETTGGGEIVAWLKNQNLISCTVSNSSGVLPLTKDVPWEKVVESATEGQSFAEADEGLDFDNVVPGSEQVRIIDTYLYDQVNITSPTIGQLPNGNILGPVELIKNGTPIVINETVFGPSTGGEIGPFNLLNGNVTNCALYVDIGGTEWFKLTEESNYTIDYATGEITNLIVRPEIVNETVHGPTVDGGTGPLYLDYGHILNLSLYVDIGEWVLLGNPAEYSINNDTGEINTTDIEPYEAGWFFHAYYNHSELIPGVTIHAFYNYTYSTPLSPSDYSVDDATGEITFTPALESWESVTANYSCWTDFMLYTDYSINHESGDLRFTVPNQIANESYIYDSGTWASNNTFDLNHGNLLNCTLYYWNATLGWHKMTISSLPANISTGDYNYTINYYTGEIEFARILVGEENVPYASWNLTDGDEIYAFYNYTALNEFDTIEVMYSYYTYVVDHASGKITFTEPLGMGDTITATYTYRTTTTIPVVLNVAADDPKFEFGGANTFDVTDEDVLAATGGETSAWLTYNNIVEGAYDVFNNGDMLDIYGETARVEILNNTNVV